MKKLTLLLAAAVMFSGVAFGEGKSCCKKKGEKCEKEATACCKKGKKKCKQECSKEKKEKEETSSKS